MLCIVRKMICCKSDKSITIVLATAQVEQVFYEVVTLKNVPSCQNHGGKQWCTILTVFDSDSNSDSKLHQKAWFQLPIPIPTKLQQKSPDSIPIPIPV